MAETLMLGAEAQLWLVIYDPWVTTIYRREMRIKLMTPVFIVAQYSSDAHEEK